MPHFKIMLSGTDIALSIENATAIGFFTTRVVRAPSIKLAEAMAKELVLSEWRQSGAYAENNHGNVPALVIDESYRISLLARIIGGKPSGYSFYQHAD
jgi:hypothetical protein